MGTERHEWAKYGMREWLDNEQ